VAALPDDRIDGEVAGQQGHRDPLQPPWANALAITSGPIPTDSGIPQEAKRLSITLGWFLTPAEQPRPPGNLECQVRVVSVTTYRRGTSDGAKPVRRCGSR
jgi:hypothetical protein